MFSIELELPSGKKLRVPELNNRDYLDIIKFCSNDDLYGLEMKFRSILSLEKLSIIDVFYTLVYMRSVFIGNEISFAGKDKIEIKYSLDILLEKIISSHVEHNAVIKVGNIQINTSIPNCLYFENIDALYTSTIKSMTHNGIDIDFSDLSKSDQTVILDRLPTEAFLKIQQFINTLSEELSDITLIENNDMVGLEEYRASLLGNSLVNFIKLIFNYDLNTFYEMMYNYNHFVSNGSGDFFNLTFLEVSLLMNIHADRIKKENEESKKQNR